MGSQRVRHDWETELNWAEHLPQIQAAGLSFPKPFAQAISYGFGRAGFFSIPQTEEETEPLHEEVTGHSKVWWQRSALPSPPLSWSSCCFHRGLSCVPASGKLSYHILAGLAVMFCLQFFDLFYCAKAHITKHLLSLPCKIQSSSVVLRAFISLCKGQHSLWNFSFLTETQDPLHNFPFSLARPLKIPFRVLSLWSLLL